MLHTPIVRFWLVETGLQLRGGYIRLKTAYLKSLPLPPLSRHTVLAAALVRRGLAAGHVDTRAVDAALCRAYGFDEATWQRAREL